MDLLYVREFLSENNHNRNAHREKQWYFFTLRERKYPNGTRPSRSVAHGLDGYWKATSVDKAIISDGQVIGFRKALDFYDGNQSSGIKTKWKMHEYRLNQKSLPPNNSNGSDPTKVWSRGSISIPYKRSHVLFHINIFPTSWMTLIPFIATHSLSRRYYGRIKFQVFKLWIKLKEIILIPYQELDFFHPTCHTKSESRFFLQLDDWVLCKVYMKGGSNKSNGS